MYLYASIIMWADFILPELFKANKVYEEKVKSGNSGDQTLFALLWYVKERKSLIINHELLACIDFVKQKCIFYILLYWADSTSWLCPGDEVCHLKFVEGDHSTLLLFLETNCSCRHLFWYVKNDKIDDDEFLC